MRGFIDKASKRQISSRWMSGDDKTIWGSDVLSIEREIDLAMYPLVGKALRR